MSHIHRKFESFDNTELTDDEKLEYINDSFISLIDEYNLIQFEKYPLGGGYISVKEKRNGYTYYAYDTNRYQLNIKK
jgi:hypothetical protein